MKLRYALALLLFGVVVSGGPAFALPRVTLKLEKVSLHEALKQLRAATGWGLEGTNGEGTPDFEPDGDPGKRASFEWKDANLGRVCRDLSRAFGVSADASGPGMVVFREAEAARAPSPWTFRSTGVALSVRSVSQTETHAAVPGQPRPEAQRTLKVDLTLVPDEGDPDIFCRLDQVQAVDVNGVIYPLTTGPRDARPDGRVDAWEPSLQFKLAPRGTPALARLEGTLILFGAVRHERVEVALPAAEPVKRMVGQLELTLKQARLVGAKTLLVEVAASWPAGVSFAAAADGREGLAFPGLRSRSGELEDPDTTQIDDVQNGDVNSASLVALYTADPDDPPQSLVWDLTFRAGTYREIPFLFRNIPIPEAGTRTATVPESRGAALRLPVRIGTAPARHGELAVGLSRRAPTGSWGPVRWYTVPTDARGVALLRDVAPGEYRVTRRFRAAAGKPPLATQAGGAVTIRVERGKTDDLPPLIVRR